MSKPLFMRWGAGIRTFASWSFVGTEQIASGSPGTFRPSEAVKHRQVANFVYNVADGPGVGVCA